MATIAYAEQRVGRIQGELIIFTWPNMQAGDDGQPVIHAHMADRTVQMIGTPGPGAMVFEGTLETTETTWGTLTDPQGNALSLTTAGKCETVTELVYKIRPRVSAGDGTTSMTGKLLMRRTFSQIR
jgi:hypothetical protein